MRTIHQILDENETIFWEGKPAFFPFVFNGGNVFLAAFGLIWSAMTIPFLFATSFGWFIPHVYIGPIMIFGPTLYRFFVYNNIYYAVTNKRVLLEGGLVGRDLKSIDFDQITDVSVNVDLFDKLFNQNTGSIFVMTPGAFRQTKNGAVPHPHEMDSIHDPYVLFKKLKEVSHSVKADINYPNAMRPAENPGYNTAVTNNPFDKKPDGTTVTS